MTAAGHALMAGLIDYAGLFPPANLTMPEAVQRYRESLAGKDRWALGRFVVPAASLADLSAALEQICDSERDPAWSLSVLTTPESAKVLEESQLCYIPDTSLVIPTEVREANAAEGPLHKALSIDSIELKAASMSAAERVLSRLKPKVPAYVEFDPGRAPAMLPALARAGARAKIRTGGVAPEAFPCPETVANFLLACARAKVPVKATAGLHHAMRGSYQLTEQADSASAAMHGFANVFLAAALAWRGAPKRAVLKTLEASEFSFSDHGVRWQKFELSVDEITQARREFAISYGSCSFEEPIAEARALGWIA